MWQRYIMDPLRGRTKLSRVIWLYGFGVTAVLLLIEPLFVGSPVLHGIYYGIGTLVGIAQSVMLWRCSYNAKSPLYGSLLRIMVVLGLLLVLLGLYVLWSHPEILQLVE